jgi:hypothetical protein
MKCELERIGLIRRLYNDPVSTSDDVLGRMKWEDDHEI